MQVKYASPSDLAWLHACAGMPGKALEFGRRAETLRCCMQAANSAALLRVSRAVGDCHFGMIWNVQRHGVCIIWWRVIVDVSVRGEWREITSIEARVN